MRPEVIEVRMSCLEAALVSSEAEHLDFFQMQLGFELAEYVDREAAATGFK